MGEDLAQVTSSFASISLDANTCIYFLSRVDPWFEGVATLFRRVRERTLNVEISGIVKMELLVGPFTAGDVDQAEEVLNLTDRTAGVTPGSMSRELIVTAAEMRAMTRLKTPDALVVASAALNRSGAIVGNDRAFDAVNELSHVSLIHAGVRELRVPRYIHLDDYIERPRPRRRSRKPHA